MRENEDARGDVEIVGRILDGETDAFAFILSKYGGYVAGIVKRHVPHEDIEDTAHEVFVRVYESLPTFKGTGGFQPWLASIAVRTCFDYWRARYRAREVPLSSLTERHREWLENALSGEAVGMCAESESQREGKEILDWALSRIPAEERMVLELVYLQEYSVKEAAALLGWSTANVKVRSFRARRKLRGLLSRMVERGGRP
jgi:RNA polymerase sigma-70 factor (ECF subfamily)